MSSSGNLTFIPGKLQSMRSEFYSVGEYTPELKAYLLHNQIDHATVTAHAGVMAVCQCSHYRANDGGAIFIFDPHGQPSVVIEALGMRDGTIRPVDLVSWPIACPEAVATAVREAEFLGPWNMVKRGGRPLRVWRTPLDWLQAGCEGCVPVNEKYAGYWLHRARGPFVAQDIEHGREIRAMLGEKAIRHQVLVPEPNREAA